MCLPFCLLIPPSPASTRERESSSSSSSSSLERKSIEQEKKKKMMMMMNSEVSSAARNKRLDEEEEEVEVEVEVEEEELELGLSLGAKKINGNGGSRSNKYCRILTAKDFPAAMGSRASPISSSSSSETMGGGGGGGGGKKKSQNHNPQSQVVVGWPPIRAFRMNSLVSHSKENASDAETADHKKSDEDMRTKNHEKKRGHVGGSRFVKVNMDGDPIGRKVDLNAHVSYETLALALETMFQKPTTSLNSLAYSMKASKLLDGSSEFALTYEDKDGDWMLVGDVPWGMFLDTVKRLRIMRTSDASGLAPRFQASTGVS